jgi:hypothetical protein
MICAIAGEQVKLTCQAHGLISVCQNQPQQVEALALQWVMEGQNHECQGSQTSGLYCKCVKG